MSPQKTKSSPNRPPESKISLFLWRWKMWIETTFALSMMEPWEKLLLLCIFAGITMLLVTGLYKYTPQHLYDMQRRMRFYFLGQDGQKEDGQWMTMNTGEL